MRSVGRRVGGSEGGLPVVEGKPLLTSSGPCRQAAALTQLPPSDTSQGTTWGRAWLGGGRGLEERAMAIVEDCDQILLAGTKTSDEGWRENGERGGDDVLDITNLLSDSFHDDDGCGLSGVWEEDDTMVGRDGDKGWESWEEAGSQDLTTSETSTTENIFEIMRNGTLSQVEGFIEHYGVDYSLDQRDEYGHSPAHWMALNGHTHVCRCHRVKLPKPCSGR